MTARESGGLEPPVIQYWDDWGIPGGGVGALLRTFDPRGSGLPHLLFNEHTAGELIAERFDGRRAAAFRACAVAAMQADYFRYCAVHALGGVYADADFRCVSPLRPLVDGAPSGTLFGRPELPSHWRTPEFEWRERVGPYRVVMNSFFAFPLPHHPLLELAIEIATANIEAQVADDVALVTGPAIFTSLYLMRELGSFDAFVQYAEGGVLASFSGFLCTTIGDHERVVQALDGVRIASVNETDRWVEAAGAHLAYKETDDHWVNATADIFR